MIASRPNFIRSKTLAASLVLLNLVIITSFYQKLVEWDEGQAVLKSGYGWSELVQNIENGKYEVHTQSGLDNEFDMISYAYRPPVYPLCIWAIGSLTNFNAWSLVFFGSIVVTSIAVTVSLIVEQLGAGSRIATMSLLTVYFWPMNFLKAGSPDEAPLMLLLFLIGLYLIVRSNGTERKVMFYAGLLFGLSILTRFTMVFPVFAVLLVYSCYRIRVFIRRCDQRIFVHV